MKKVPMRKIRDVLRLDAGGLSKRRIAASLGVGATSVGEFIKRARHVGLSWPLPDGLSDEALERLLFPPPGEIPGGQRAEPDWALLHLELRKPNVTLLLLWEAYRAANPGGYGCSRFRDLHRTWKGRLTPTMRQNQVAGEKMFVDYAGATLDVIDGTSGEILQAQVFVAVLGATSYTYAEATDTMLYGSLESCAHLSVDGRGASGWRKTDPNGLAHTVKLPKSACRTAAEVKLFQRRRKLGTVRVDLTVFREMSVKCEDMRARRSP